MAAHSHLSLAPLVGISRTLFVISLGVLTLNHVSAQCPITEAYVPYCTCVESGDNREVIELINCRGIGNETANEFPDFFDEESAYAYQIVRVISITSSHLGSLPDDVFASVRVRSVLLRNQGLEEIQADAFQGLVSQYMEQLDVQKNSLTSLRGEVFRNCSRLKTLMVQGNQIGSIGERDLVGLSSLDALYLENNSISVIHSRAFDELSSLKRLYLFQNQLSYLEPDVLLPLVNLEELNIRENQIESLPVGAFSTLTRVTRIDLAVNRISTVSDLLFQANTQVEWLDMAVNNIVQIKQGTFYYLTKLRYLDLSTNNLTSLAVSLFDSNSDLETLYMDHNRLEAIPSLAFESNRKLNILHLHENAINSLAADAFGSLNQLQVLKLQGNDLPSLPYAVFDSMQSVQKIFLSNNLLTELGEGLFDATRLLKTLDLSENRIRLASPAWLRRMHNVTHLDLSRNHIQHLALESFSSMTSLLNLDLSSNPLQDLHPDNFAGGSSLEVLFLNNTCLSALPDEVFGHLSNLRELYLQNNDLRFILNMTFEALPQLERLHLGYNRLDDVAVGAFGAAHLPQLVHLGLEYNRLDNDRLRDALSSLGVHIQEVNVSNNRLASLQGISTDMMRELNHLDVSGNTFECACASLEWLQSMPVSYDPTLTWCHSPSALDSQLLVCAHQTLGCDSDLELPLQADRCLQDPNVTSDVANSPVFRSDYKSLYVDIGVCNPGRYTTTTPATTSDDASETGTGSPETTTAVSPVSLSVIVTTSGSKATVYWAIPEEHAANIRAFRLTYQQARDDNTRRSVFLNDPEQRIQGITNLARDKNYTICVLVLVEDDTLTTNNEVCADVLRPGNALDETNSPGYLLPVIAACAGGGVILFTIILVVCIFQRRKRQEKKAALAKVQDNEAATDRVGMWVDSFQPGMDKDEAMMLQEHTDLPLDTYNPEDHPKPPPSPPPSRTDIPDLYNSETHVVTQEPDVYSHDKRNSEPEAPELDSRPLTTDDKCY